MRRRRDEEVAPRRAPALARHAHELSAREQRRDVRAAAQRDSEPRWYMRPATVGLIVLGLSLILNFIFW